MASMDMKTEYVVAFSPWEFATVLAALRGEKIKDPDAARQLADSLDDRRIQQLKERLNACERKRE